MKNIKKCNNNNNNNNNNFINNSRTKTLGSLYFPLIFVIHPSQSQSVQVNP